MARRSPVPARPLKTYGLTHLALGVKDVERAFAFYEVVFGMVAVYRSPQFLQAQTPGARDAIVFERSAKSVGKSGGIAHFGFRLKTADDIVDAAERVRRAGARLPSRDRSFPASRTCLRATRTAISSRSGTSCRRPPILDNATTLDRARRAFHP